LGSISGCITPQGRQFINTMGYTAAGTFVKGSVRKEMGHRDYQSQQRKENRTYVPKGLRPAQLERAFFACNYWKDFNNDGTTNYPEEYVGIKNKFRDYETIVLVLHDGVGERGTKIVQKIFNPKGEEIYNVEKIFSQKGCSVIMGINGDAMGWLIEKGGYGNFKSVWYINNAYADSTEFEIVHSEQTKKLDK